jgi:3-hydroxy-3-methylglutaryl CoA synthase
MVCVNTRGLAVPGYRISTGAIREQWGGGAKGVQTKTVQAKADDSPTRAVRAGRAALDGRTDIDAFFFATTTPVYEYGSVTPLVAESLGLDDDTYVQSFSETARAGTAALRAAHGAVATDSDSALVVAAEAPSPAPESDWEKIAGAGAAAAVVEADGEGLEQVATGTCARSLLEEWQEPGSETLNGADDRFARDIGYLETTGRAINRALEDAGWTPVEVSSLVVTHPNGKFASKLASAAGVDDDALATPSFGSDYGNLRAAGALGSLARAELAAGDRVVVAGYGSGAADALAYEVTEPPAAAAAPGETVELDYVEYLEHVNQLE